MYNIYSQMLGRLTASLGKLVLIMKLTFLITIGILQVAFAGVYAQKITLNERNAPLGEVLKKISIQSGYDFLMNTANLKNSLLVNISVKNVELDVVLKKMFDNQPYVYSVEKHSIVISEKERSVFDRVSELFADITIRGKITDQAGQPIAAASIAVKGSGKTVLSATDGSFTITVPNEQVILVVSYIGYVTQEFTARNNRVIVLKENIADLDQVVVTGYTSRKASELTGGVQTIGGDELRNGVSSLNPLAMLKGVATGLYIVEPGGSVANRGQMILRGQSSFNDNSNANFGPLIVVDGVITNAANLQDIVDAQDIETINILRDAASTAVFGSRAAQGVIVVTTKRGSIGKLSINFGANYGKVQNTRAVKFMNTEQATAHITKAMQALYNGTASIRTLYPTFEQYFNATRIFTEADRAVNTEWDNTAFFSDGDQTDMNLSVSSGTERTRFYAGVKWSKQDGTLLDDNVDRKSFRINVDQKLSNKLTFSLNTNALLDKYTATTSETQYYLMQPWVSPYYSNGGLADSIPNYTYRATSSRLTQYYDNPLYSHEYNTAITKRLNLFGTGTLKYDILPWLSVQSANTINYTDNDLNSYKDPRTYRGRAEGAATNRIYVNGSLALTNNKTNYFLTSNLININKTLGDHQLKGLIGQEYSRTHSETVSASAYNSPYPGERNLGAFLEYGTWLNKLTGTPARPSSPASIDKASFSIFGELSNIYKSKYLASASVRRDASTNFGQNNRYGTFYSISGGWLINREDFLKDVKALSNLKLRAAYGTSGREAGADFLNFTTYTDNIYYNTMTTVGSTINRLGNDNITWETTYTTNLGLDIGLFNRININVDLYNKDSKNLLQNVTLPSYVGFATQNRNVGTLRNRGLDIQINSENIRSKDFSWDMGFNISFNKNKIVSLQGDSIIDGFTNSYYRYVGDDINTLRAIKYVGVNADNGRPLFERIMGDGGIQIVDSIALAKLSGLRSYQIAGSATPKFFGGWTNNFRYKNIRLSILMNFSYGNKIFNNALRNFVDPTSWQNGFNIAQPDASVRFWQGQGDTNANYPDFYDLAFAQRGGMNLNSSLLYVDASYLRMRNVRLSYDFAKELLTKVRINSLNVFVSADNVFVIKSKELFAADPEGATIGTTSNAYGGSGLASAMPRRFVIGLIAGF